MGKIELDHTGSGSGITLSSDGTDLLLDGTAIGGGGGSPDLYSDSANGSAVTPTSNAGGSYNSVAIGNGADIGSGRGESIAIGTDALTNQSQAIALGKAATVGSGGSFATALGRNSLANGTSATAIGTSYASGSDSLAAAIANNTSTYGATGANSIAMGDRAKSSGSSTISIGKLSQSLLAGSTAVGEDSRATGNSSTAVGKYARASGVGAAAFGAGAYSETTTASGDYSLALGYSNTASGARSVVIGKDATSAYADSFAIGNNTTATAINQITLGSTSDTVRISSAYTLPTSDGTNGQVLTTDGSGAVTFADAGGGGGSPDLFAENYDGTSTLPSATGTNALALQDGAVASANRSIAVGQDAVSSGIYAVALGVSTDAINFYGTALGYKAQAASGDGATALTNSRASGSYSFAAAIANNTSSYGATGSNSVAIGKLAKATSTGAVGIGYETQSTGQYNSALGGYQTQATGTYHSLGLGSNARSTAFASTAINGGNTGSYATADWSVSMGGGALSNIIGKFAYSSAGAFGSGATGDAQQGTYVLRSDTTNATAEAMTTNNSTAGTTNQVVLPNNSAYSFSGTIVARQQASAGTASAAWKVEGLIRREGSAGTTVLVNSATTVLDNTPGWGLALSADTTNGGLAITVTGAASTNIRWVATIHTSEVIYA